MEKKFIQGRKRSHKPKAIYIYRRNHTRPKIVYRKSLEQEVKDSLDDGSEAKINNK